MKTSVSCENQRFPLSSQASKSTKGFVLKLSFGFRNIAIVRQRHPLSRLITQRTRIKSRFVFSFEHAFMPDLFSFIARSNL